MLTSADANGTFAWTDAAIVPGSVGTHSYSVTYTPNDSQNYNYDRVTLTQDVSVTVNAKSVDDDSIAIAPIADQPYKMCIRDRAETARPN